jgi:Methyltransferase domain
MTPPAPPTTLDEVRGSFSAADRTLFDWLLDRPEPAGNLLELGSHLGKSAIVLGRHQRAGETLTVCDSFEGTRAAFKVNYLAFNSSLPRIAGAGSKVKAGSCRFVHVDASRREETVRDDMAVARAALCEGGILAFDDDRSARTPGLSAAVWEAVFTQDLHPICVTGQKLFGTWGDAEPVIDELLNWLTTLPGYRGETLEIAGRRIVKVLPNGTPKPAPAPAPPPEAEPVQVPAEPVPVPGPPDRIPLRRRYPAVRLAVEIAPPLVTRTISKRLQAHRDR